MNPSWTQGRCPVAVVARGLPLVALAWSLAACPSTVRAAWVIEIVDGSPDTVGAFSSLAIDAYGRAHVSYFDAHNGDLKYASRGLDGLWQTEVVDSEGTVGTFTSLALDGVGQPAIAYFDATNKQVKFAHQCAPCASVIRWSLETVGSTAPDSYFVASTLTFGSTSLAYDPDGMPHVAYIGASGDFLYATRSSGGWTTEEIASPALQGAIAFSTTGTTHASLAALGEVPETEDVRHGVRQSGGWTTELLWRDVRWIGVDNSIAVDTSGVAHIAWIDHPLVDPSGLRYATSPAEVDLLDPSGQHFTSIKTMSGGAPVIAYDAGSVRVATRSGSAWILETVDSTGSAPSLALDGQDHPRVAYAAGGHLLFAYDGVTAVGYGPAAVEASLEASPTPFRHATTISLRLLRSQPHLGLTVSDVGGRVLARLVDGPAAAGVSVYRWPTEASGTDTPAGVYVVRATGPGLDVRRLVTLLR